jgi:CheY-like chemotaxis protein
MKKVLLVDDMREPRWVRDPHCTEGTSCIADSYEVEVVRSGEAGVEALKRGGWDAVFLDHDMGHGMTGMGVIRFLDENHHLIPKQVHLVTANIVAGPNMYDYLKLWHESGIIEHYSWVR